MFSKYPEFAWFEGIVNALTHRDYSQKGEHVKVIMYDDRLEILSPGKLPNIVDFKNMKYTRYPIIATDKLGRSPSYCRNLLNKLKDLDIMVWRGSSLKDPTQYYELNV